MNEVDLFSELLAQVIEPRLRRGKVNFFGFVDQGTNPIGSLALRDRAADGVFHLGKTGEGNCSGIDWLAARWFFAQFGNIHISEVGEDQCARYRRGGQYKNIDCVAFLREREPLVDAKPVLLIDNGQRQVVESNVFLKQRMRADQKVDIAYCKTIENLFSRSPALAAGEDGGPDGGGFGERHNRCVVLTSKDFGRCHESCLASGFDDCGCRSQCHNRFSRTDVALQQAQHPMRAGEVGDDIVDRLLL